MAGAGRSRTVAPWATGPVAVAALAAAGVGYRRVLGPWQRRWGATDAEVGAALPGDAFVAEPAAQTTRAVAVRALREEVWSWVVQVGADRGGFYSYDWVENLFRLGIHSADDVVPAWQHRAVGDLVHADAAGSAGWYVMQVLPGEALVLKTADVAHARPMSRDEGVRWEFLWTFVVRDAGHGTSRLLVRERVAYGSRLTAALMAPVGVVSFVMTRKMMLGIRDRAEQAAATTSPGR